MREGKAMEMSRLAGTWTALVTPFRRDAEKSVDIEALEGLVEAQIAGGIQGLVPCGTTGETPTLTKEEKLAVLEATVRRARGRVPVLAGTGSNSTQDTLEMSKKAVALGADAVMVVVPYYNRPTQAGLAAHFVAVAQAVPVPVVVYNIPGRTGCDLQPETLERICAAAPNVVAVKEATGNVLRAQEIKRRLGDRLAVFSGDDALTLAMMAVGASGVISVTSNLLPREVAEVPALVQSGRWAEALTCHRRLLPLHEVLFVESNPGPVKYAMALAHRVSATVRPPLVELEETSKVALQKVLEPWGIRP